jgi:hypothetical protein
MTSSSGSGKKMSDPSQSGFTTLLNTVYIGYLFFIHVQYCIDEYCSVTVHSIIVTDFWHRVFYTSLHFQICYHYLPHFDPAPGTAYTSIILNYLGFQMRKYFVLEDKRNESLLTSLVRSSAFVRKVGGRGGE